VTLHADGKNYKLCTTTETVSKLLEELGITLDKKDLLSCDADAKLENGMEINVIRAKNVSVKVDGKVHNKLTNMATVKDFLDNVCIYLNKYDEVTPALETPITEGLEIKVARVTVETPTVEEAIPFTVVKKQSSEHFKGETVTQQKGVNGLAKNTYRVVKRDGKLVTKTLTNSETIKKATDKIVLVGTREKMGIASRGDLRYKKVITCTATAYDPGVHSNGKWAGITATGRPAGPGIVAVDPKVIPLNSRLYIESTDDGKSWTYGYAIAGDTGGAIKGNRIDLCYSTVAECYQFGRRQCKVYILE
ncbi:MAG: G5 domain-containing protein, partial [Clostridia bacterium]|nr:G5 domain-containing protein [Clostridia bacterium]